jgi:hypothetical protein
MAARHETVCPERTGRPNGRPLDPLLRRALLGALRGALRRSVVLLPLSEEDDLVQQFLEAALGAAA